jgi:hypothetical protein
MDDLAGLRPLPDKHMRLDSSQGSPSSVSNCDDGSVLSEEEDPIMGYESVVFRSGFLFFDAFVGLTFYDWFSRSHAIKVLFLLGLGMRPGVKMHANMNNRRTWPSRMLLRLGICVTSTSNKIGHRLQRPLEALRRPIRAISLEFLF